MAHDCAIKEINVKQGEKRTAFTPMGVQGTQVSCDLDVCLSPKDSRQRCDVTKHDNLEYTHSHNQGQE